MNVGAQATRPEPKAASPRFPRWAIAIGIVLLAIVLLAIFWDWNWFRPLVESQASTALGRKVTLQHFDLKLRRVSTATADGVAIANPSGFPSSPELGDDFARIGRLVVTIDVMAYLQGRHIVIPSIVVDKPQVMAAQPEGQPANWSFPALSGGGPANPDTAPRIGDLQINDGTAHVVIPHLKADFQATIATAEDAAKPAAGTTVVDTAAGKISVTAKGTYANQPIDGRLVGGALLSLRDAASPYPVDLQLANGPTKVSLVGTIKDPVAFKGADLKLHFAGPDMALLFPLTGIPIPKTPSYVVDGNLDYQAGKVLFHAIAGKVGSSDLEGDIDVDTAATRPVVTARLASRLVDLADLGGFIGSEPGRVSTPNQTAQQKRDIAKAEASAKFLPTTTISLPKLKAADVHLVYRGSKILGRDMPFDSFAANLDIVDGKLDLHPVQFGMGRGSITATMAFTPVSETEFHTKGDIAAQRIDLGRVLEATHMVHGSGTIGGRAVIDATGNSMATILGTGNGSLQLTMSGGGDISALLVDISGFEVGNAILSALGVPNRDPIECFVGDFALQRGVLETRTLLLDTEQNIVSGTGSVNLRSETLDMRLKTDSKHFSIGTLPAPIAITGSLKSPGIKPDLLTLGARGGAAVGLGILFPPAALLPTIQFGVGDDNRCGGLARRAPAK